MMPLVKLHRCTFSFQHPHPVNCNILSPMPSPKKSPAQKHKAPIKKQKCGGCGAEWHDCCNYPAGPGAALRKAAQKQVVLQKPSIKNLLWKQHQLFRTLLHWIGTRFSILFLIWRLQGAVDNNTKSSSWRCRFWTQMAFHWKKQSSQSWSSQVVPSLHS
jgi:hypothetical protein